LLSVPCRRAAVGHAFSRHRVGLPLATGGPGPFLSATR
jgi:hypothetical protein